MNRNTRTLIVLAVAVLMAGVASFGVYMAVRSMPVREVEIARTQAVVAARPLQVGVMVTKDDLKIVPWPAANPVPGSFTEIERVVNRGVIGSVSENEPLTEAKLAAVGSGAGLPPTITEGMRAVSIRVNEIVGVAGFVIPGTRVGRPGHGYAGGQSSRCTRATDTRRAEQRASPHSWHSLRSGARDGRGQAHSNQRRHLAARTRRRREAHAGVRRR